MSQFRGLSTWRHKAPQISPWFSGREGAPVGPGWRDWIAGLWCQQERAVQVLRLGHDFHREDTIPGIH